jgi:hypothetical protein
MTRRGPVPKATHAARVVAAARSMPPAQPGARAGMPDTQSDYSVTSRIDRLPSELTPAPLPPSPAAEAADVWFEQVPTNPAAVPDLNVLGGSRPDLGSAIGQPRFESSSPGRDPWAPPNYNTGPVHRVSQSRRLWLLPVLLTATALTVGMVLGALLFGRNDAPRTKSLAVPVDCPAPEAATPGTDDVPEVTKAPKGKPKSR